MLVPPMQFEFVSSTFLLMPQKGKKSPQVSDILQAVSKFHCYLEDIWIKTRIFHPGLSEACGVHSEV